jgi:hypothetical protein
MHTVPPANNLKSLANLEQELCHLAKVDRAAAMGTDGPEFFRPPPGPLQGFAARDGHDFPWPIDEPMPGVAAGQNSAGFPEIRATFQRHILRRHF